MPFAKTTPKNLLILLALLFFAKSVTAASVCDQFAQHCLESNGNLVLGDKDVADKIVEVMNQSAVTYQKFFAETPRKTAIVGGGTIDPALKEKLAELGFAHVLPWITKADRKNLQIASIRSQVEEQAKAMPEALKESIMAQAIAQLEKTYTDGSEQGIDATEAGALAHELGHIWFIQQFSPKNTNAAENAGHGYGGWAPDWLDETAAVLMENSKLTDGRREAFSETLNTQLISLDAFISMEHPAYKAALELAAKNTDPENSGGNQSIILTGDEADEFFESAGGDPTSFYVQVRAFADFMIEQYEDQQVFRKIAAHLSQGGNFEDWLSSAATKGQPSSLQQLDVRWQAWITAEQKPI